MNETEFRAYAEAEGYDAPEPRSQPPGKFFDTHTHQRDLIRPDPGRRVHGRLWRPQGRVRPRRHVLCGAERRAYRPGRPGWRHLPARLAVMAAIVLS